jgi:membrane-bound lytic murein transglycosylase B
VAAALFLTQQPPSPTQPVPAGSTIPAPTPTPSPPSSTPTVSPASAPSEPPVGITAGVDAEWADALAAELGIPARVFWAYAGASSAVSEEFPECGLGWNTLAGIGWVESHHGTIGGSAVTADGQAEPPILGIALDGSRSARIRDTDDGALDGDRRWDRAVGPMQFIPSTWAKWGTDGNGDGVADPQQIDDAAHSAARYLCAVGGDLTRPQNWIAAVAAYNDSVSYNNQVADAADLYARRAQNR